MTRHLLMTLMLAALGACSFTPGTVDTDALRTEARTHAHPDVDVLWPVQANELFVELSKQKIASLREAGAVFYEWPRNFIPADRTIAEDRDVVRLVTAFTTQDEEVEAFIAALNS